MQGLKQEVLISDSKAQNRALNGDIVAVEILPKSKWLKNYKQTDMADVLDEDLPEELADEDDVAAKAKLTLMQ